MKNFIFLIAFTTGVCFLGKSQNFANEWIDFNADYLKITVNKKGIFQINQSDISAFPQFNGADPRNFKLYHGGIEVAILVTGEADGVLNTNDYIQFYSTGNDGIQDDNMYLNGVRLNPYYSIYSDETAYFLTIGTTQGKRMANVPTGTNPTIDNYFIKNIIQNYNNIWTLDVNHSVIAVLRSTFDDSEGLGGPFFRNDRSEIVRRIYTETINLPGYYSGVIGSMENPKFEAKVVLKNENASRDLVGSIGGSVVNEVGIPKISSVLINKPLNTINTNSSTNISSFDISLTIANSTSSNFFASSNNGSNGFDAFSIVYYKLKYPSSFQFNTDSEYQITPNSTGISHLNFSSLTSNILGLDITDVKNPKQVRIEQNIGTDIFLTNNNEYRNLYLSSTAFTPLAISYKKFEKIIPSNFDYLIVTHRSLLNDGVDKYRDYRNSASGGSYKVYVGLMDEIYDQFSYGERNPFAIKRMSNFFLTNSNPKYLFLIGSASARPNELKTNALTDLVPSFGYPGSDLPFSSGLAGFSDFVMAIPTGRLQAKTPGNVIDYLNKVKAHELLTPQTYERNLIYVSGPKENYEYTGASFKATLDILRQASINSPFKAKNTVPVYEKPAANVTTFPYPLPSDFFTEVNNGVRVITYYGHGGPISTSYNLQLASTNASLTNKDKYPFLYFNGCDVANSYNGSTSLSADWLLTPNKGAINSFGQTAASWSFTDEPQMKVFYNLLFGTSVPTAKLNQNLEMINSPVGNLIQQWQINSLPLIAGPNIENFRAVQEQTVLEGDPANTIFSKNLSPLPLVIENFDSDLLNDQIQLHWKTSEEINIEKFVIERSNNLSTFTKIGELTSNGNKSENNEYLFLDKAPLKNINYYRLKAIEIDGNIIYSKIIAQNNVENNDMLLISHPSTDNLIRLKFNTKLKYNRISLFDNSGKLIPIETKMNDEFVSIMPINTNFKGVAILKILTSNNQNITKRILIN